MGTEKFYQGDEETESNKWEEIIGSWLIQLSREKGMSRIAFHITQRMYAKEKEDWEKGEDKNSDTNSSGFRN